MNYIHIDDQYKLDKEIALEKIFKNDKDDCVQAVFWKGNIKPQLSKVIATVNDSKRYEEIQLLQVVLSNREQLYSVARCIHRSIKYPCVVEYMHGDATTIGTVSFDKGKRDNGQNVNIKFFFSHWIRKDFMSAEAEKMISSINAALNRSGEIADIVLEVGQVIANYRLGGTSKAHVARLVKDMVGSKPSPIKKLIANTCVPIKYYPTTFLSDKYSAKSGMGYRLIHDYEELWYCFMTCEETRRIIENRRYRNIEDMILRIDSKY